MEPVSKKFKRSNNFSVKEETLLVNLVKKYKNNIECKRTDANTNKIKSMAWTKLVEEFNMMNGEIRRDLKTMKNKYENIKKRTKQKYAEHKSYATGTGGGPDKVMVITTIDSDIQEIIGTQLTGHISEFDDDTLEGKLKMFIRYYLPSFITFINYYCRVSCHAGLRNRNRIK